MKDFKAKLKFLTLWRIDFPVFENEHILNEKYVQIEISSLLPSNVSIECTSHRRVDFAIFHPQLDEKIIVEIDGKQHNNHMEDYYDGKQLTEIEMKFLKIMVILLFGFKQVRFRRNMVLSFLN